MMSDSFSRIKLLVAHESIYYVCYIIFIYHEMEDILFLLFLLSWNDTLNVRVFACLRMYVCVCMDYWQTEEVTK